MPELSRLLDEALALEAEQLEAWYAALPVPTKHLVPALRRMVAEAHRANTSGLLSSLPHLQDGADDSAAREGEIIGPYRLLRPLGQGGMGTVWLVERADGVFKRQVALKLPRLTWAAGLVRRMARERDIGAMLEHPSIARLYDAGIDDKERPYLALEYIDGVPIDVWCKDKHLSVKETLKLIVQVVKAVAYAHEHLVVHRDLKPSNVLVSTGGQAHLLDFGIARLLDEAGEQATQEHTRAMSPQYASPEQLQGQTLTVHTDIYSLGVMAYELLTGSAPHTPKRKSLGAMEEAILSGDVPPLSTRVMNPAIRRQLKGDVDAILGKAMKVDPAQRYATAEALAMDIERYLEGQAVSARPDSAGYRLRKSLRRNWIGVSASAAVLISILLGYSAAYLATRASAESAQLLELVGRGDAGPLSIVVLPFANLTGDPNQAYVADGLTAAVTADLARISDAFVVESLAIWITPVKLETRSCGQIRSTTHQGGMERPSIN